MMRGVVAGLALVVAFSGAATAQSAGFDWTGFYVGGNGGYGWDVDGSVGIDYSPVCAVPTDCPDSVSLDTEGFVAGGHGGANWQKDNWVFGVEGDIDWSNVEGSGSTTSGQTTVSASTDLDWLATLRGRLGWAADRALVYATGGVAFGEVKNSATLTSTTTAVPNLGGTWTGSESGTEVGWAAGGGVEYALTDHIVIGAEALYVDLGDRSVDLDKTPPISPPDISASFDNQFVVARGRVSFKW